MPPNFEGLQIRPAGQKTRTLTSEEFEQAVSQCVLTRSPYATNRDHLFNCSCDVARAGWSMMAVKEFEKAVMSRIGEHLPAQA
jgi:hypothetical protein